MDGHRPRDPAERGLMLRFLYRDWRPTLLGRWVGRLMIRWTSLPRSPGIVGVLEVQGNGPTQSSRVPMVVTMMGDRQYLVSMLGPGSIWVRNVEAAGGRAVLHQQHPRAVHLAPDAPLSEFERIAVDYPVYRVDPVTPDLSG